LAALAFLKDLVDLVEDNNNSISVSDHQLLLLRLLLLRLSLLSHLRSFLLSVSTSSTSFIIIETHTEINARIHCMIDSSIKYRSFYHKKKLTNTKNHCYWKNGSVGNRVDPLFLQSRRCELRWCSRIILVAIGIVFL
jgi:hypothetical protein